MTEQPTALRLAQELDAYHTRSCHKEAAAELRRLHAENERVFKLADDQDSVIRRQRTERQTLEAQRDALLEALKAAEPYLRHANVAYNVYVQARAAIKAVEENT